MENLPAQLPPAQKTNARKFALLGAGIIVGALIVFLVWNKVHKNKPANTATSTDPALDAQLNALEQQAADLEKSIGN